MDCIGDYYHKVTKLLPIKFQGVQVIPIKISFRIDSLPTDQIATLSSSNAQTEGNHFYNAGQQNVGDALLILNDITLHCNKLIDKINDEDRDISKKMQDLRNFKEKMIQLSYMVDQIIQHHKHSAGDLPSIDKLREVKNEALKLITRKKRDFLKKHFGDAVDFSNEELVLAALGLNSATAKELTAIEPHLRCHQTDLYHLKDIVCKTVEDNCLGDETDDNIKILTKAGFTEARAKLLDDFIAKHRLCEHQSLAYWVETYLDHMFQYDIFLNRDCPLFPHDKSLNEWFVISTERETENEDGEISNFDLNIRCINTTTDKTRALYLDELSFPTLTIQDGVWYHGTDHDSAERIRKNGIEVSSGRRSQDFSHGSGFYLSPYYSFAIDWATKKGQRDQCAVVVFKHSINAQEYKGLDLTDDDELWRKIVKYNRSGREKSKCDFNVAPVKKKLKGLDYIDGPMSGDNTKCGCKEWQPTKKHGDEAVQLCVLSQDLADEFSNAIKAIIFFHEDQGVSSLIFLHYY